MTNPTSISPLRQRMIEDMTARGLTRKTQRGHILACKRFAAYLKRSPDTATAEDVRLFQFHLMESGLSIQNRNRTMTGVRFLLRVTMRRHDLAAEIFHMKEPQKIPQILSAGETKRLLTMAGKLQVRDAAQHRLRCRCAGRRALAVPRPAQGAASDAAAGHPPVPGDGRGGRDQEEGHPPYAAAQLCDPSVRPRRRYQDDSGFACTREVRNDSAIYAGCDRPKPYRRSPGSAGEAVAV